VRGALVSCDGISPGTALEVCGYAHLDPPDRRRAAPLSAGASATPTRRSARAVTRVR